MEFPKEQFTQQVPKLLKYMMERLNINSPPAGLILKNDTNNATNLLGKTGYYDPQSTKVTVFVTNRHPKDVLRSFAHEVIHHFQNENGTLDVNGFSGEGYAQKNPKLRTAEKQAFLLGNMLFRDWEDSVKANHETD